MLWEDYGHLMSIWQAYSMAPKMLLSNFINWYARNIERSILITLVILLLQVPHFLWGGDVVIGSGLIAKQNPVLDFILYGIDLLEVPLIIKTIADFIILKRR